MADNLLTNSENPSRLLNSTDSIRNILSTRNLYNPDRQYPLPKDSISKTIDTLNSISTVVSPFRGTDLNNTVFSRLVDNDSSPLAQIGLVMLGKQFAMNTASHVSQQTLPVINVGNLFDGNKSTKLFTKNIEYSITSRPVSTFARFVEALTSSVSMNRDNPFIGDESNDNFIKNTGEGQLYTLLTNLNNNLYKDNTNYYLNKYGDKVGNPIQKRDVKLANWIDGKQRSFYNFIDSKFNPYIQFVPSLVGENIANEGMLFSNTLLSSESQEYAPNADYINNNFGKTNLDYSNDAGLLGAVGESIINDWIGTDAGIKDNIDDTLVWGRDGASDNVNKNIFKLQGSDVNYNPQDINKFNIKTGLLEYTRNLLNATDGNLVDITRKAFVRGDKIAGFNGSGIWKAPSNALGNFAGKTGVRQHSVLDQYDNFAKAIRFDGNNVYGGNKDSVIHNNVIPKFHPTFNSEDNASNNKNMMFSIENLAVRVISADNVGIIDDEYGTQIPASEVGPFNGRVMWFPPYNLDINEVATAKYDQTTMVGRSEPIYSYMNSERSATLNFTLLVDYPEQLRNYAGSNKNRDIAEFFAFGTTSINSDNESLNNVEAIIADLETKITKIEGSNKTEITKPKKPSEVRISFPNALPSTGNVNSIIDFMYSLPYEKNGINESIYVPTDTLESQYNLSNLNIELDNALNTLFINEDIRPLYKINVTGYATKLYYEKGTPEELYNKELGQRRADAIKYLIEKRLEKITGEKISKLNILITTTSKGSLGAKPENATEEAINTEGAKNERVAVVSFEETGKSYEGTKKVLTQQEENDVASYKAKIADLNTKKNVVKKRGLDNLYNERGSENDAGILKGFQSVSGNYLYPAFHSQTPEDLHKRLTFLHQCTKQGASKRYDVIDEDGIMRAKNSVFGRQPICILRIGDLFYTKVIIENVTIDYNDTTWDMNPEGYGMQPMMANITLQMKLIGGQSLKGPIDALQNAVSFNHYANSNFYNKNDDTMYGRAAKTANDQELYINGILDKEKVSLNEKYKELIKNKKPE